MMKLAHTAIKRNAKGSKRMACVSLPRLQPITDNGTLSRRCLRLR